MKIIFCLNYFLPDSVGGTEIYVLNLGRVLLQKKIDAVIVIPNFGIDSTEEYLYEGIRVIKYAENSHEDRRMILGKTKPEGIHEFVSILKKEKPDIVHFHELAPGSGISIFHVEEVYKIKIPVLITFHVPFYTCLRGSLLYKGQVKCDGKIIVKRCTDCIFQQKNIAGTKASALLNIAMAFYHLKINLTRLNNSLGTALGFPYVIDKMKKDILRFSDFAEKIVVIADWYQQVLKSNGVPQEKMIFIKQGLPNMKIEKPVKSSFTGTLRVVYIGRITALKGVHLLIDALLKLPAEKITLDIYGRETSDSYILECKQKTKGHQNIHWKGGINSSEVIDMLSKNDLLCVPSAFEMSPLVIQEAFAAGIPVLASNVYGNAEQITENENGWLFDYNNPNELKFKLQNLINEPGLIENAKRKIPSVNTFENVGSHHIELYKSVVRNYISKSN